MAIIKPRSCTAIFIVFIGLSFTAGGCGSGSMDDGGIDGDDCVSDCSYDDGYGDDGYYDDGSYPTTGYADNCGNGIVEPDEDCDDGDLDDTNACTGACRFAVCGDGFVLAGVEECDDTNLDDTDDCTSACNAKNGPS